MFRVVNFREGRLMLFTQAMDYVTACQRCAEFQSLGYTAEILPDSRDLRRLPQHMLGAAPPPPAAGSPGQEDAA